MNYPEMTIIGLMSGTSLDGLDLSACKFKRENDGWSYEILKADTVEYNSGQKEKLKGLMAATALELAEEHFNFGYFQGEAVATFLEKHKIKADYISSHGHTIFHQPEKGFTFQIGHGACISARCGLPVISDFRALDVAMGGQGAPLVPIGDKLLFNKYAYCLNLGGIANVSFDNSNGSRIAFDICPVNLVLNKLAQQRGFEYDKDGFLAESGRFHKTLFDKLESLDFYRKAGPKSLGKEWVDAVVFPILNDFDISVEDKLKTFSIHIVERISRILKKKGNQDKVLITGGGAFNKFIINELSQRSEVEVIVPDAETVMFKEALIFAFLGYMRLMNINNCIATVTGARADNCGGLISSGI